MVSSQATIAPLLLRNLITSLFVYTGKPFLTLAQKYRPLELIRAFLISTFLFFLSHLPSLFPTFPETHKFRSSPVKDAQNHHGPPASGVGLIYAGVGGDSGIARALTQLLSIINDVPVSSRKYEVVRSLAERLIDENLSENSDVLREVTCGVLSAAFSRTLAQLESAVRDQGRRQGGDDAIAIVAPREGDYYYSKRVSRLVRAVRYYGDAVWRYGKRRNELSRSGSSAEKLAAELLWLAQKMAACGCVEETVRKWASASNLAWLSLTAEPRLQGSIVKVSAFLIKQAKEMGTGSDDKSSSMDQQRQTKLNMLMSWLPLLCHASNGTDSPVLSVSERAELEKILEEIIETLDQEEEQEKVLALWLHLFTYCPSSDWPNLHGCYTRWFNASRKKLLR